MEAEALVLSGYAARKVELQHANEAIEEQLDRLSELEPATLAGIVVYARAISACREGFGYYRSGELAEVVANALLRIDAERPGADVVKAAG